MAAWRELGGDGYVEYFIFPDSEKDEDLSELVVTCHAFLATYVHDYNWHNEAFVLQPRPKDSDLPAHLYGITRYRYDILDKWFVIVLLFKLTKAFHGLVVRVTDERGEFLSSEIESCLPKLADSESFKNKVYIYEGAVHLIPVGSSNSKIAFSSGQMTVKEAVILVRNNPNLTVAKSDIQEAIEKNIDGFPEQIKKEVHRAHAYVPVAIAACLTSQPALLPWAVEAFYETNSADIEVCKTMQRFPPDIRVMIDVEVTKRQYVQIICKKYAPPDKMCWNLPDASSINFKAYDLGMKLACGFEILASKAESAALQGSNPPNPSLEELCTNDWWNRYVSKLEERNHLQLARGSQGHRELVEKARQYFISYIKPQTAKKAFFTPAQRLLLLLDTLNVDVEELEKRQEILHPADDDDWVNSDDILSFEAWITEKDRVETCNRSLKERLNVPLELDMQGAELSSPHHESPRRPPRRKKRAKAGCATFQSDSSRSREVDFNMERSNENTETKSEVRLETDSDMSSISSYEEDRASFPSKGVARKEGKHHLLKEAPVARQLQQKKRGSYVEYYLFPGCQEELSEKKLSEVAFTYHALLACHVHDYIWQNEAFVLQPSSSDCELPLHLYGITWHEGNVLDKWFVVFLLYELTKAYSGLVVRTADDYGEFLAKSAENYLPKWADLDTCKNRVYICNGSLHLVPVESNTSKIVLPSGPLTVGEAVSVVRNNPNFTVANSDIQEAIKKNIDGFPEKMKKEIHRAHAYVPAAIAACLAAQPALSSQAVLALHRANPADMEVCKAMRYFPPETRVMTRVEFTKHQYIKLIRKKYTPPKKTGWNLPNASGSNFKAYEIGMKLACGFEILASKAESATPRGNPNPSLEELCTDILFNQYHSKLKEQGYFQMFTRGSNGYQKALEKSRLYYINYMQPLTARKAFFTPTQKLLALLDTLDINMDELKEKQKTLSPADDDGWVDDCDFKACMAEKDLVETCSIPLAPDMQGAEISFSREDGCHRRTPQRPPRQRKPAEASSRKLKCDSKSSSAIDFEPESVAVDKILDFSIPEDKWETDSDMSGMSSYAEEEEELCLDGEKIAATLKEALKMEKLKETDDEVVDANVIQTVEKQENATTEDDFDDVEDFHPVNVDATVLKNLNSYRLQQSLSGPASNLLSQMGTNLQKKLAQKE